ncbi:hypothetical protein COM18_25445, partial [Bacillus pseudomycoides]
HSSVGGGTCGFLGCFVGLRHASRTLKGIETVQALYKQNRNLNPDFGFSAYDQLRNLFAIT